MLLEATVGVPLMVHVLLSMDRPVGSAGETVHDNAPVTSVMSLLMTRVVLSHVLLPETVAGE